MPLKLRREAQQYRDRAINSMRLAVEHFNRPYPEGRQEAVLHFLLHAHEMLAKSILLNRRRQIQDRRESKSISFTRCLNLLDGSGEKVVDDAQKLSLTALSNLRDAAQHSVVELSEQELYLQTQTSVTVFDELLGDEFGGGLADHFPSRVLPVSTEPPDSIELLVDREISQIKNLLEPGRRQSAAAKAKLRSLLALDLAAADEPRPPTPLEVDRAARRLKQGRPWRDVLPNVATLALDASGSGQTFAVKITKAKAAPGVRFAETEDEAESAAIIREVDLSSRYPFTITQLAKHVGISLPRMIAVVWKLDLKGDPTLFHEFRYGKASYSRQYSHKALERLREAMINADLDAIWEEHRSRDRR